MEAALKDMAGPGRRDPRRRLPRRQAAAEIADPRHPLPARLVRGGEPRRRPRVRRHHDQSRAPARCAARPTSPSATNRSTRGMRSRRSAAPEQQQNYGFTLNGTLRQGSHVVLADEQRHQLLRFADDLRGGAGQPPSPDAVRRPTDRANFSARVDHALTKAFTLKATYQRNDGATSTTSASATSTCRRARTRGAPTRTCSARR